MKVRTGFVSNSSSSSFVIIFKAEDFNKKLEQTDEYTKGVMNELTQDRDIFGTKCVVATFCDGNYDSFEYIDDSVSAEPTEEIIEEAEEWGYTSRAAYERFVQDLEKVRFSIDM